MKNKGTAQLIYTLSPHMQKSGFLMALLKNTVYHFTDKYSTHWSKHNGNQMSTVQAMYIYDYTSMQYTVIVFGYKNGNFQIKNLLYFSYFCSDHISIVGNVRTASMQYLQSMFKSKN